MLRSLNGTTLITGTMVVLIVLTMLSFLLPYASLGMLLSPRYF